MRAIARFHTRLRALPGIAGKTDSAAAKPMVDHGQVASRLLLGDEIADRSRASGIGTPDGCREP